MKFATRLAYVMGLLIVAAPMAPEARAEEKISAGAELKGLLADVPVYAMEWHVWYATPFQGPPERRYWSWPWESFYQDPERAVGPAWKRRLSSSATPLIGPYSSDDPEVIRWQLRCMKAAGITATQVQLFPHIPDGKSMLGADVFAQILDLAAEEKMPVFIHDEVQFREGPACTAEAMGERITSMLSRFGQHPGYYKIDGKPVYTFQYWNRFLPLPALREMLGKVKSAVPGGAYFLVNGGGQADLYDAPEIDSLVAMGSSNDLREWSDRNAAEDAEGTARRIETYTRERSRHAAKPAGVWLYMGFDGAGQQGGYGSRWRPREENLGYFRRLVAKYAAARPDFVQISSWNDWLENSAIEPAGDIDGLNGDPYEALRLLALLKGKDFQPPPLPALDHLDPWMSAPLGGPDKTPPYAVQCWVAPNSQEVRATFADETSPIAGAEAVPNPAFFVEWNDDGVKAAGLSAQGTGELAKQGRFTGVSLKTPLRCKISDAASWKPGETTWLVVTYFDNQKGHIAIKAPNENVRRLTIHDGAVVPDFRPIACSGTGEWRTEIRRLDGLAPTEKNSVIALTFHPAGKGDSPLVGRVSLARDSDFSANHIVESASSPERSVATYRVKNVPWDRASLRTALVRAKDSHGNVCEPLAVTPGFLPSSLFAPYPINGPVQPDREAR